MLNVLNFFKKKGSNEVNGLIGQFKLVEWWNKHFDKNEQMQLIEAYAKEKMFGVGTNDVVNDSLTESTDTFLSVTPLVHFNILHRNIDNDVLQKKFLVAVDELVDYYLSIDFDVKKEYLRVIPEQHRQLFDINDDNYFKWKNHILDIDFLYNGIIYYHYKKKSNLYNLNTCIEYCQKAIKISELLLKYRNVERNYYISQGSTPTYKVNLAFEKYVMILQFNKEYDKALEIIDKSIREGWVLRWDKRIEIINKLKNKSNN